MSVKETNQVPTLDISSHEGLKLDKRTQNIVLTCIKVACEALAACSNQLNIMDAELADGDYGSALKCGVTAIQEAIEDEQLNIVQPSVTFKQISHIIEKTVIGVQGRLYCIFFNGVAKVFSDYSESQQVNENVWLNALSSGNKTVCDLTGLQEGDRTMLDSLIAVERKITVALKENDRPLEAFYKGVAAAEERAIQTLCMFGNINDSSQLHRCKKYRYPDPGAHGVGIWMRAVYEGAKLKMPFA